MALLELGKEMLQQIIKHPVRRSTIDRLQKWQSIGTLEMAWSRSGDLRTSGSQDHKLCRIGKCVMGDGIHVASAGALRHRREADRNKIFEPELLAACRTDCVQVGLIELCFGIWGLRWQPESLHFLQTLQTVHKADSTDRASIIKTMRHMSRQQNILPKCVCMPLICKGHPSNLQLILQRPRQQCLPQKDSACHSLKDPNQCASCAWRLVLPSFCQRSP